MDLYSVIVLVFMLLIILPFGLALLARISQNRAYFKAVREHAEMEERIRAAQPAAATVIDARMAQATPAGEALRAHLTLRVEPPGAEPFTTAVDWLVEPAMQQYLEPGSPLSVKIDAHDPRRVYPNLGWAKPVE
ncbi:MAG TPA: hypothetical protein VIO36_09540 [Anaerolineaceae bacterium]